MNRAKEVERSYGPGNIVLITGGIHIAWTFTALFYTVIQMQSVIEEYLLSLVVIMIFIGMIFGGCFGGFMVNRIGRKRTAIIAAANVLGGGICFVIPLDLYDDHNTYFSVLCVGRFFMGFAFGLAYVTQTVYIGEIASAQDRGKHLLNITASTYAGCFIHFCYLNISVNTELLMGILTIIFGMMAGIFTFLQRESPYYLFMKGNYEEGVRNLKYFRKTEEITDVIHKEIAEINGYLAENTSTQSVGAMNDLLRNNGKALVTCFILKFVQAVTYNPVLMMVHIIFCLSIQGNTIIGYYFWYFWPLIILGLIKTIGVVVVMCTTDRTGRRKWLLISGCCSALCLLIIPVIMFRDGIFVTEGAIYASAVLTLAIEFFVALGFGSIPDVIVGESVSMASKPLVAAFSCVVVGLTNIIYYYVFVQGIIGSAIGISFYWILYGSSAAFIAAATLYCHFQLPETSRMTLREAKERYQNNTTSNSKTFMR